MRPERCRFCHVRLPQHAFDCERHDGDREPPSVDDYALPPADGELDELCGAVTVREVARG